MSVTRWGRGALLRGFFRSIVEAACSQHSYNHGQLEGQCLLLKWHERELELSVL